jgi:hypothetical protein
LLILGYSFVAAFNFPIVWSRASLDTLSDPVMIAKLRDQLLARERELDHREKLLLIQEHGVVDAECSLRRACMEYDVANNQTGAVQQDYLAQLHDSTTGQRCSLEFDRVLSAHWFILSSQETELEHQRKSWLMTKHEAKVEDDCAIEAEELPRSTI